MKIQPVLIAGHWQPSQSSDVFRSENPATQSALQEVYPISSWADIEAALNAAAEAAIQLREVSPEVLARFLETYADLIEQDRAALVALAHAETALPVKPRLAEVELPRTTNQLRLAAAAARSQSWRLPTIDTSLNIRSCHAPLGPVWVFGPNNFPFAFNSIAGGDFAAALATGCPVIAKANTSHPGTTHRLALAADTAARDVGLPSGSIQLIYRTSHQDGARAVADRRTAATGYTGSRQAGLTLKAAADAAGKPIYLELSSVNPVVLLPGAVHTREADLAADFTSSCLMGTGQFCTNPGLVLLLAGPTTESWIETVAKQFRAAPIGTLLSRGVAKSLGQGIATLCKAGASVLAGETSEQGTGYCHANTLLRATGRQFLAQPERFQTEAFGNASLVVVADDVQQLEAIVDALEGNLTGSIYSDEQGQDDAIYDRIAPRLRTKVGRLLNDKMPTGVAVSPAMNHGGPYPATGHPGFTAVGMPASLRRFTALECYDQVRGPRLPAVLQDANPSQAWRLVDGHWTQAPLGQPT